MFWTHPFLSLPVLVRLLVLLAMARPAAPMGAVWMMMGLRLPSGAAVVVTLAMSPVVG